MRFKELFKEELRYLVVPDVNVGIKINNFFNQFNNIKNIKDPDKWKDDIKNFRAGTYSNMDFCTIYFKFRDDVLNNPIYNKFPYLRQEFEKAISKVC
jgi:hypothetical protein